MGVDSGAGKSPNDDDLMVRVKSGDHEAFRVLFDRYWLGVTTFCATYVPTYAVAEECAQETFLRLWRARHQYVPQGAFKSYLFTIGRNCAIRYLRLKSGGREDQWSINHTSSLAATLMALDSTPASRVARRETVVKLMG